MATAHMGMRKRPGRKADTPLSWLIGVAHREFRNPVHALLRHCVRKCTNRKGPKK